MAWEKIKLILLLFILVNMISIQYTNSSHLIGKEGSYNLTLGNSTDFCSEKIDEFIKYIIDPQNSTFPLDKYKGILLYSSFTLNDYGDYTNCINEQNLNYISISLNATQIIGRMALCFFKECDAKYFNNSKNKIITLINYKYGVNVSEDKLNFSNPKENLEDYRSKSIAGLVIGTVIISLISLLSIIKFIYYIFELNNNKTNFNNDSNMYQKFINNTTQNKSLQEDRGGINVSNTLSKINKTDDSNMNLSKSSNKSFFTKFLENFDVIKNTNTILKVENNNKVFEYLRVFDGVRCLSTCWVLWAHVFYIGFNIGQKNFYEIVDKVEKLIYCLLSSGVVSVDVFFYLSGFLLYFNLIKYIKNVKNRTGFFFISLFQRYIRLMPFYFIAIFYITFLLPFLINSGKVDSLFNYMESCRRYWWTNIFYIQNFIDYSDLKGQTCVGHSWYLCDDMIYFVFTTILILLVKNKKLILNLIILVLFILSIVWEILIVIRDNYSFSFKKQGQVKGNFFFDFYIQPHARITPYLLGILYCQLFFETDLYVNNIENKKENLLMQSSNYKNLIDKEEKNNFSEEGLSLFRRINQYLQNNNLLCYIIFIFSLILINYSVFINKVIQIYDLSQGMEAFMITFNKIFFIIGLGNILHLIFLDKFTWIKNFLSLKIFTQLSRLTYGVYILHYYVVLIYYYNSDSEIRFDIIIDSFLAIGLLIVTLILSYILGVLFESPVINMLKNLRGSTPRESKIHKVDGENKNQENAKPADLEK